MGIFDKNKKESNAFQGTAGSQTQAGNPTSVSLNARGIKNAQVHISNTDYGAIGGALGFAETAIAGNAYATEKSLSFAGDALNTVDSTNARSIGLARDSLESSERSAIRALSFGNDALSFGREVLRENVAASQRALDGVRSASASAFSQLKSFAESQSTNNDQRIKEIALWGVGIVAAVAVGPQLIAAFKG